MLSLIFFAKYSPFHIVLSLPESATIYWVETISKYYSDAAIV